MLGCEESLQYTSVVFHVEINWLSIQVGFSYDTSVVPLYKIPALVFRIGNYHFFPTPNKSLSGFGNILFKYLCYRENF